MLNISTEETRVKIANAVTKVIPATDGSNAFFDPKADADMIKQLYFVSKKQLPHVEWLKSLKSTDTIPRGKCSLFYKNNAELLDNKFSRKEKSTLDMYAERSSDLSLLNKLNNS